MKTILVDAIGAFVIEGQGINEPMYSLLETFGNRKIILTSADDQQSKQFGLDQMPYEVFTLKHEPNKTDPAYFKVMLKHFSLSQEDVVYFEHDLDAVQSAKSVGITSYYYDPEKRDLDDLKKFLLRNL